MSIEHHHTVLFTIHEQTVTVRLDQEITLSALFACRTLGLHSLCVLSDLEYYRVLAEVPRMT